MQMAAVGCAALAVILGIAGTAAPKMIVYDKDGTEVNQGLWSRTSNKAILGVNNDEKKVGTCTFVKDAEAGDVNIGNRTHPILIPGSATDCAIAKDFKCKTQKAFSIIGILAGVAGAGAIAATAFAGVELPWVAALGANAFAAFSYMIIWAISASMFKENDDADAAKASSCGYFRKDTLPKDDFKYGASFALLIVAFILHLVASGLVFATKDAVSGAA